MKTIDEILNEWYPTIPDEEHNGLYARDKVKLIAQEFADQFRQPDVVGRSEQLKASFQIGEKVLLDDNTEVEVIVAEPKLYIRQNEFDSEMWVNIERLKKKSL